MAAPRKRQPALQNPSPDPIEDIIQRMGTPMRLTIDVVPSPSTPIEEGTSTRTQIPTLMEGSQTGYSSQPTIFDHYFPPPEFKGPTSLYCKNRLRAKLLAPNTGPTLYHYFPPPNRAQILQDATARQAKTAQLFVELPGGTALPSLRDKRVPTRSYTSQLDSKPIKTRFKALTTAKATVQGVAL